MKPAQTQTHDHARPKTRARPQTPLAFFWPIIKPYKWWCLLMLQAPIIGAFFPVLYNYAVKLLIDLFTKNEAVQYAQAFWPILYFITAIVMLDIAWRLHNFAAWRSQPYIESGVMCKSYEYLLGHSYIFFANQLSGALVSKIKGIHEGVHRIYEALTGSCTQMLARAIVSGGCLLLASPDTFFVVAGFSLVYIPFCIIFFGKLMRAQEKCSDECHNIIGFAADGITNIFTLFAFASRQREIGRMKNHYANQYIPLKLKFFKLDFWVCAAASALYWILLGRIFISLIQLRNSGRISVGDIAFIISMAYIFAETLWNVISEVIKFVKSWADFKSAFALIASPQDSLDKPDAAALKVTVGAIEFSDVNFKYEDGKTVFAGLNLAVKSGQKIGLVPRHAKN